jgi:hypothetical protein
MPGPEDNSVLNVPSAQGDTGLFLESEHKKRKSWRLEASSSSAPATSTLGSPLCPLLTAGGLPFTHWGGVFRASLGAGSLSHSGLQQLPFPPALAHGDPQLINIIITGGGTGV